MSEVKQAAAVEALARKKRLSCNRHPSATLVYKWAGPVLDGGFAVLVCAECGKRKEQPLSYDESVSVGIDMGACDDPEGRGVR